MRKESPLRALYSSIAAILLGSAGIAVFSGGTIFSAAQYFVFPSALVASQFAYARMGKGAGFGTAIALAVPSLTLAAAITYFLWPNETDLSILYLGFSIGLVWGVVMPIFTPPYRDDAK